MRPSTPSLSSASKSSGRAVVGVDHGGGHVARGASRRCSRRRCSALSCCHGKPFVLDRGQRALGRRGHRHLDAARLGEVDAVVRAADLQPVRAQHRHRLLEAPAVARGAVEAVEAGQRAVGGAQRGRVHRLLEALFVGLLARGVDGRIAVESARSRSAAAAAAPAEASAPTQTSAPSVGRPSLGCMGLSEDRWTGWPATAPPIAQYPPGPRTRRRPSGADTAAGRPAPWRAARRCVSATARTTRGSRQQILRRGHRPVNDARVRRRARGR